MNHPPAGYQHFCQLAGTVIAPKYAAIKKVWRSEYQLMLLLLQVPIYTGYFTIKRHNWSSSIFMSFWESEIQSYYSLHFLFLCLFPLHRHSCPEQLDKNVLWTDSFLPPQELSAPAGWLQIFSYTQCQLYQVPLHVKGEGTRNILLSPSIQKLKQPFSYIGRWIIIYICLLLRWVCST